MYSPLRPLDLAQVGCRLIFCSVQFQAEREQSPCWAPLAPGQHKSSVQMFPDWTKPPPAAPTGSLICLSQRDPNRHLGSHGVRLAGGIPRRCVAHALCPLRKPPPGLGTEINWHPEVTRGQEECLVRP